MAYLIRAANVVLAASLAAACSKEAPPPPRPAPQVTVVTVKPQSIPYIATFVAQTESSRQVDIVARISGFLDKIAYTEGELVEEGKVLFQIDPKPFRAQLDSAMGELRRSRRATPPRRPTSSASSRSPSSAPCRRPTSTRRRASSTRRAPRCSRRRRRSRSTSSTSATPPSARR